MSDEKWEIATTGDTYIRENNGSFVIMEGDRENENRNRVATVELTVKAKRNEGWRTDDPKALARGRLIAAAPELLEALKEARSQIFHENCGGLSPCPGCTIGALADAAIAKATTP